MSYQPDPFQQPLLPGETAVEAVVQPVAVRPVSAVVSSPLPVGQVVYSQPAVIHRRAATSYVQRFAADSVIVGVVGVALMIVGLIAVTRAGVDGPMSQPVVKVFGFTHTATLGAIEAAVGVLLLICAAMTSRGGAIFFGVIFGVGAIVGAVQNVSFRRSLALQAGLAWLGVVAAAVVVLVSLLMPRIATRTSRVESI